MCPHGEYDLAVCLLWRCGLLSNNFGHLLLLFMVALCNRADHIYFHPVSFLLLLFFSSPNLSGRRLDVYHTLAHGVALVQI